MTGMATQKHSFLLRLLNYSFGTYGFFLYQPLMILPFLIKANYKNKLWIYVVALTLGYLFFNALMQKDYGGSSFGPRRFLVLIPVIYYFIIINFRRLWKNGIKWRFVIAFLIAFNILFTMLGHINPWENWNYFDGTAKRLYFPLLFTIRKILRWYNLDQLLDFIK
jgi:hypothetical protein